MWNHALQPWPKPASAMARKNWLAIFRVIGTVILFAIGLRLIDWRQFADILVNADPLLVILAFIMMLAAIYASLLRYHAIVAAIGADYPVAEGWRLYLAGHGFNQLLPTGLGGDMLRVAALRKRIGWVAALQSIVLDRLIGLYHMFVLFFLLLLLALVFNPDVEIASMVKLAALPVLGGLFGIYLLSKDWLQKIIVRRVPSAIPHILAFVASIRKLDVTLLSLSAQALFGLSFAMLGYALGPVSQPLTYFALIPSIFILMQVPVSLGGWGMREAAAIALLPIAGMTPETAFANALLYGILLLLSGLFGLVFWLLAPKVAVTE